MTGRRIAGAVAVVLAVLLAAFDIFYYMSRHPRRGLVALIACGVLLVLGIVLIIVGRGSSKAPSGT